MGSGQGPVGLAEFTAALSLAADQAAGLSLEHGLRTCLLATRLARRAGLADDDLRHVYYTALLRSAGCTSDAHEQAELFGDEIAARTRLNLAPHLPARELLGVLARHSGAGEPPMRRAAALGRTLAAARDLPRRVATAHCETARRLSGRLSLPDSVSAALHAVFERWDGSGFPDGRAGAQIPVPARFAQLSYDALLLHEHLGSIGRIAGLTGACYDPDVVVLLRADDAAEVAGIVSPWEAVLAAEPGGPTPLDSVQLDAACEVAADFADLKSPWLLGHSRGVAELAEAAAWRAGLDAAQVAGLRRAALLHDLGRVVVPSGIWDRPGPLRDSEWELVRLHAYHGERVLARSLRLAPLSVIAGAHHERLDGSGYHRGSAGAGLPAEARLLAALAEAHVLAARPGLAGLPLAGVPVAVKDNVDVAGAPTRHGSAATPAGAAQADDELVQRLRAAGCVVIGKTQMPELAIWPFTEPQAYPVTRNPWDTDRTPGGSTGGGAAALASGMAALALGSDGGGSIRIPAACCGVVGLKPGPGVVPLAGGMDSHWYGLTAFGPLARTVGDIAAALDVLTQTAAHATPTLPDRPLRIACSAAAAAFGARLAPSARAAVEDTAAALRGAGHQLVRTRPPIPANLGLKFMPRWLAGIAQDAADLPAEALEERTAKMARRGQRIARKVRPASADPFVARAARWISGFDALIMPTMARSAVPIGTWADKGWFPTALSVGNWLCTMPWNLAGLPAISVPAPAGGLPVGVQIVAPAGGENVILSIAAELERLRPWPQLAPLAVAPGHR